MAYDPKLWPKHCDKHPKKQTAIGIVYQWIDKQVTEERRFYYKFFTSWRDSSRNTYYISN